MSKKVLDECLADAAKRRMELPFYREYYDFIFSDECKVALLHKEKNFENEWGLPYDHNMISSLGYYINASPMNIGKHRYIAAQGPREKSFADFWHMIWEENAELIATVTNEKECESRGMIGRKFDRYWPDSAATYGNFHVELLEETTLHSWQGGAEEQIKKRQLLLSYENEKRAVTHLHLENWLDNDVVRPESLHQLSLELDRYHNNQPIVVHCAAGIGRTGTLIAYHSLYHDVKEALRQGKPPLIDIPARVKEMRELRWGAVVSSRDQYDLLVETLGSMLALAE